MSCPSQDCRGVRPEQRTLDVVEKAEIDAPDWTGGARVCSSCGCVYTREERGFPVIRGWLNSAIAGPGWKAARNT